jgi:hypothetical protein
MVIDAREPKILERPGAEGLEQLIAGRARRDVAARHLFEQILQLFV